MALNAVQLKKKMPWLILLACLVAVLGILFLVEDWKRDFTTNHATTDAAAEDPALRPLVSHRSPEAQADRVRRWVAAKRQWNLVSIERQRGEGKRVVHLVRITPVWRFKDDIHVTITPTAGGGSVLEATSRSRVGKGDLGQNPRNLRELIGALSVEAND